ncbi:hypothetical protein [Lewinella sp. W8]|uniref:hypothetical protein n=1 Tax=Lewinella sp. W8 TaxID=2528208 RepID=UPI001067FDFA|nr:hypothetical protein [Lewinella sp. W8]MTB49605.1 hypothetical protein [Lewinella sp. W8]
MSEIKSAGFKGYVVMGAAIALLLFVFLVVYLYQYNDYRVPEDPQRYGALIEAGLRTLTA